MNAPRRKGDPCARAALNNALAVQRDGEVAAAGSRIRERPGDTVVPFIERDHEPTDAAGNEGDHVTCGAASGTSEPLPSCIPNQNTVAGADTCGVFVSSTGRAGGVVAHRARPSAFKRSAITPASSLPRAWMTVEQAAAFLSLPVVTLRRSLERNARATPEGGTISHMDGVTARKLGRLWRVWLDSEWLAPGARK